MLIVRNKGLKKKYAYGGEGIFDTFANFLTKLFTSSAAKQIASSAVDVGKSVAKEGAKKALEIGKNTAVDAGKKLVEKALLPVARTLTPKSKKFLEKYAPQKNINALIDGSAITIQDLVKKINTGSGIKVLN